MANVTTALQMFKGSAMDATNVDATLNGWAAQAPSLQNNVSVEFPAVRTAASNAAVTLLTTTYSWTIIA